MTNFFSLFSAIIFIASYYFYIISIFRKETKPQKASWIIWSITDIIILATLLLQNVSNYHLSFAATIGSILIVFLSFKYGVSGWRKIDFICLSVSGVGLLFWQLYNNPLVALIILSLTQIIATIPTAVYVWKYPKTENKISWGLFFIAGIFGVFAIPVWNPENYVFPLSILVVSIPFFIMLFRDKNN